MKKIFALIITMSTIMALSVSAQQVKENIEKHAKDPAGREKAAKADRQLTNKKIMPDTSKEQVKKPRVKRNSKKKAPKL